MPLLNLIQSGWCWPPMGSHILNTTHHFRLLLTLHSPDLCTSTNAGTILHKPLNMSHRFLFSSEEIIKRLYHYWCATLSRIRWCSFCSCLSPAVVLVFINMLFAEIQGLMVHRKENCFSAPACRSFQVCRFKENSKSWTETDFCAWRLLLVKVCMAVNSVTSCPLSRFQYLVHNPAAHHLVPW